MGNFLYGFLMGLSAFNVFWQNDTPILKSDVEEIESYWQKNINHFVNLN